MKRMKKIVLLSAVLMIPLAFLTGCSKVSLTGSTGTGAPQGGEMGTPPDDGGTPPEGGAPENGGTPPSDGGAPSAPAN